MECFSVRRPNRSDMHLPIEEEMKIEQQTREYFDGVVPKRHTKPQRSEYSTQYVDVLPPDEEDSCIPELAEFHRLEETQSQKLIYSGSKVSEEFVETEYYQDLNCVDKQHHTTGTGFIKMEKANGKSFCLTPDSSCTACHSSCKGNPATNDWIPAAPDLVTCASDKPNRSEN